MSKIQLQSMEDGGRNILIHLSFAIQSLASLFPNSANDTNGKGTQLISSQRSNSSDGGVKQRRVRFNRVGLGGFDSHITLFLKNRKHISLF